jgi:hypothetical protein
LLFTCAQRDGKSESEKKLSVLYSRVLLPSFSRSSMVLYYRTLKIQSVNGFQNRDVTTICNLISLWNSYIARKRN